MPRLPLPASVLAALMATAAHAAVPVATFNQVMPPPGLYQIDSDGQAYLPDVDTTIRQRGDGATGDVTASTATSSGGHAKTFKGDGPIRYCLPPRPDILTALPPGMAAHACKTLSTTGDQNGIVHVAQCAMGRVKVTIRRLSSNTWEFIDEADLAPAPGAPNLNMLKPMMEQMAKSGNPQERAKARQFLADLPRQQAEMDAQREQVMADFTKAQATATPEEAAGLAQAMKALNQHGPRMQAKGRTLWTRLAEGCK